MGHDFSKLILITHRQQRPLALYLEFIKGCAMSGITSVQLREKDAKPDFLLEFGKQLKQILDPLGIPLIVNDSIDLAVELNASGVHLGQNDCNPEYARQVLGHQKTIGLSIEAMAQLQHANQLPIDYIAASSVFPTTHKENIKTLWGLKGLKQLSSHSKHPVIAIGGINDSNLEPVLNAGAHGIAVIGALHTNDSKIKAQILRQMIDTYHGEKNDAK